MIKILSNLLDLYGRVSKGKAGDPFDVNGLSPLVWAYIGDGVFEVFIRTLLVTEGKQKLADIHQTAVKYVNSSAQSALIRAIEPFLHDDEREIVKKGRNTKSNIPRNADMCDYRYSTGLEALIGYLYLTGKSTRLSEIFGMIADKLKNIENNVR